ncbi:MAG TPA: ATPase domain-containing protein [Thermoplasmata archaeon]|nr:ATPase domain-containing protein [Thermoplasmata archaeon]
MDGSTETVAPVAPPAGVPAEELARTLGVSVDTADRLVKAGHTTPEAVRALSDETLAELGIPPEEVARLHPAPATPLPPLEMAPEAAPAPTAGPGPADSDKIVERWAGTVRRSDRARRRRPAVAPKESTDILRKWVDGDDRAMEDWIRSSEADRPVPAVPLVSPPPPGPVEGPTPPAPTETAAVSPVLEREETVVRWLTGLLDRVKSDQFDPSTMIQEVQDLQRQLFDERTKRKQLEDEVEHVKRGSIAVIKYVRSHEAKERELAVRAKDDEIAEMKLRLLALEGVDGHRATPTPAPGPANGRPPNGAPSVQAADAVEKATRELDQRLREEFAEREHEYIERETELRRRIVQLEGDVRSLSSQTEMARDRESILTKERGPMTEDLTRRLQEVQERERDLVARENELRTRFEEIRINAEENERRRGLLEFKEGELAAYDQQLQTRRQALDIQARRLEEQRRELGPSGTGPGDEARRVEDLRHQLAQKESELRARESQLAQRVQELERMSGVAAEAEADRLQAEAAATVAEPKVKSGIRRLDDLLYGGYPVGSQVLVNGPAHTGKDVLARLFSAEGLRLGVPSIWVATDKTYQQVRDDIAALFPGFADAEKKGMIRYADLYSRAVGATPSAPGVRFLSSTDKNVLDQLAETVNVYAEELKEKFSGYRLIFESVSTVTAYLDTAATFRFLQPFVGRRKLDGAVSYYMLDSGMHSDSDLETLEHMVDGSINLKVEQMKTLLAVKGIGEAQARSWVGYSFTKRSFNLGSFSLEHIR